MPGSGTSTGVPLLVLLVLVLPPVLELVLEDVLELVEVELDELVEDDVEVELLMSPDEVELVETLPELVDVEVLTPPVEVETPPVVVELVIAPDEVLVELPPGPPDEVDVLPPEVEVEPPEVEVEPVLVEEITTLPPPPLPPPKNPPKKPPPPKPPIGPPPITVTPPPPPIVGIGITGAGSGTAISASCCGAQTRLVSVLTILRIRLTVRGWARLMTVRLTGLACLTCLTKPLSLALGSATWTAPPPTIAPVAATALNLARAIRIDIVRALFCSTMGPAAPAVSRRDCPNACN
jgi:hypothetical protein